MEMDFVNFRKLIHELGREERAFVKYDCLTVIKKFLQGAKIKIPSKLVIRDEDIGLENWTKEFIGRILWW